jgi:ABC-type uncharacterized transport system substrate-binding protein
LKPAFWLALGAAGAALGLCAPASAHPHVFVDNSVSFGFADGKVTAIGLHWQFDEIFSDELLATFDADGDGTFDELESNAVAEGVLPNLAQFHYFTYVYLDGRLLDPIPPAAFVASAAGHLVSFRMHVPLPEAVDPRSRSLAIEVNDREYYVAIELAGQEAVTLVNADGLDCGATVREDYENAYFGGFVYPQEIALQCH